jgi:hypothetical protein
MSETDKQSKTEASGSSDRKQGPMSVNPERVPNLNEKFNKMLTKGELHQIQINWTADGTTVSAKVKKEDALFVPLHEAIAKKAVDVPVWTIAYAMKRYEKRFNIEMPKSLQDAATEVAFAAEMVKEGFAKRSAYNATNPEFLVMHPAGWVNGVAVTDLEELAAARAVNALALAKKGKNKKSSR